MSKLPASSMESAPRALLRKGVAFVAGNLARRTFVSFVLLSIAPLLIAGAITVHQVSAYLTRETTRNLETSAKTYGLQIYERLTLATRALAQSDPSNVAALTTPTSFGASDRYFDAIERIDDNGRHQVAGDIRRLGRVDIEALNGSKQRLWLLPDQEGKRSVYLVQQNKDGAGARSLLVAALNDEYLWQPSRLSELYSLCAHDASGIALFCTRDDEASALTAVSSADTEAYLSSDWSLFMQALFGVENWRISAKQPKAESLAPVTLYKRTLLIVMVGVLALIALLSSIAIRRSHRPLQRVVDATRRIANGSFDRPLDISSGDEYQELAQAINDMSSRIGSQFQALTVLGQIDRCILDSPRLEPIVETVLTRARDVLQCDLIAVLLMDADTDAQARLYMVRADKTTNAEMQRISWSLLGAPQFETEQGYFIDSKSPGAAALWPIWEQQIQRCLMLPVAAKSRTTAVFLLGFDQDGEIEPAQLSLARDFTDRLAVALTSAEHEQALFHQAHYDSLTQLPNRLLFKDRLEQELAHARRDGSKVAVLFVDLDRFKNINDSLGHTAGDQVLKLAALRLSRELRDVDTIARLGGDEFTIVIPQVRSVTETSHVCARLLRGLATSFALDGNDYFVGASIGVAMYPNDGGTVEELLRNADTAMYRAKAQGKGGYAFYEESMNQETRERVWIETQLRHALAQDQLGVEFQAQVELATGKVIGAEVLIRWHHPERGPMSPEQFIPIAEDTGLIVPIGEWVIRTACKQLQAWRKRGLELRSVSVNVAVPQIRAPGFAAFVKRTLREFQIPPAMLELEITESTLAADVTQASAVLQDLSDAGIRLSIDDFGTGYSSLSYLQRMPFHTLKIDRAFMPHRLDGEDHVICDAVLALAAALRKTVIAEGVETAEQLLYLQSKGCHMGQGYFFGRPVSAQAFADQFLVGSTAPINQDRVAV